MHNILKVTFVIVGTIIGAGFASGQEILSFFNKYGTYGLIGLILSLSLIAFIIYKTLKINLENNIDTYQKFIENIIPNKFKENKIVVFTINNIINIFLLISFNIMVARFFYIFFTRIFCFKNNRKFNNCNNIIFYFFKRIKRNNKNKYFFNSFSYYISIIFRD